MIPPLWEKLNFTEQRNICILNAPHEFETHIPDIAALTKVNKEVDLCESYEFIMVFVYSEQDIEKFANVIESNLKNETVLWFAYPKKSSKKYKVLINRDQGWQPLGKLDLEPVRQIAIDDDWSALRFRHISQIKDMKRDPKRKLTK